MYKRRTGPSTIKWSTLYYCSPCYRFTNFVINLLYSFTIYFFNFFKPFQSSLAVACCCVRTHKVNFNETRIRLWKLALVFMTVSAVFVVWCMFVLSFTMCMPMNSRRHCSQHALGLEHRSWSLFCTRWIGSLYLPFVCTNDELAPVQLSEVHFITVLPVTASPTL